MTASLATMLRQLQRASPLLGLAAFALALWVLHDWLQGQRYHHLVAALAGLPATSLALAVALTTAGYLVLIGYDVLALRYIGRRVPATAIATTSFIASALGNNFGNTLITGAAVRYWIYTSQGLSGPDIARVVVFCSVGFWLGFLGMGGVLLWAAPLPLPTALGWFATPSRTLGTIMLAVLALYLVLATVLALRQQPLAIGQRHLTLPSPTLSLCQIAVAAGDLCLMAAVFHALLPAAAGVGLADCLTVFLVALVVGNVSLVPGGLGVFESVVVLLLGPRVAPLDLAAALVVFRAVYFIAPLLLAVTLLGLRAGAGLVPLWRPRLPLEANTLVALAPELLAAMAFLAGTVLLFSGAVPAAAGRLETLHHVLSLPLIEASHFLASLTGAALLLLAHGLQRRLDAAWHLAVLLLGVAAVLSLAKGWDYEEAILLGLTGAVLLPSRRQFHRQSALFAEPFSLPWVMAAAMVLSASAWLVQFAHRHALHAGQNWLAFALHAEASRSLRATVGAAALGGLFGLYRLLRPARPSLPHPADDDMALAQRLAEQSRQTYAQLVLRGDKALLFSQGRDAFLMYGRSGRSWIAMGDPVGTKQGARELRWRFRDLCDRYDGWCVFFEVADDRRADYAELGLGLTPLGEQARVDLARFSLSPPPHRDLRHVQTRMRQHHCRFEIVPKTSVTALLPELAEVSAAWLANKATHEKGFSNASFEPHYLTQFPLALVRSGEHIVAFANLWLGAQKEELSVDLMRHRPDAPNGTMDFLFCELMLWGQAQGYRWFDFGMAPLSGLQMQHDAPIWSRVGTLLYRHGEHFYNFEGLRRYKAKFAPEWRPLYLASPGGVALPVILLDVATLMAGSLPSLVSRYGPPAGSDT